MTDIRRRRLIQVGSGVVLLGAAGSYALADSHDSEEETDNESSRDDDENGNEAEESGLTSIVNLVPGVGGFDFYINEDLVAEDLSFEGVTGYFDLTPGTTRWRSLSQEILRRGC